MKISNIPFIVLTFVLCSACKTGKVQEKKKVLFDTQAHRGGRGLMPENTIPAMIDAIGRGVITLELDLHITKDRQVIVSHDPYFNNKITTTPEGKYLTAREALERKLYAMSYDSIKKYDVGLKSNPDFPRKKNIAANKPLLAGLIGASEKKANEMHRIIHYNMEIKTTENGDYINHPPVAEFVDLVMKIIFDAKVSGRTMLQSFDIRALQEVNKKYPDMKLAYLVNYKESKPVNELIGLLGFIPDVFSPDYRHVTPALIRYCHSNNMKVIPWTVNDIETMRSLKRMGVDGIISDYPDLFEQL